MDNNSNFIKTIIKNDIESGKHSEIITRFPPEPNGFLHIGHARAIITNFELAKTFGGKTNLRFDDTNPMKEDVRFIDSIIEDIKWLGYDFEVLYGSDYFQEMYERALLLINKGLAYVCELGVEESREYRGTVTEAGKNSPYRDRSIEENLRLFEEMKAGKHPEGSMVLRAKIDMASNNMNMRDPIVYRIIHHEHYNTKDAWCIYPMYDYAHPLEDAIEGITHSLCSNEFVDHRPIYDWYVKHTEMPEVPRQIEFGKLNIEGTVLSKRNIIKLVEMGIATGWDDPKLHTLSGLRRRGFRPEAIREFIISTGLSKLNSTMDIDFLYSFVRNDLSTGVPAVMAVKNPLKVVITNLEDDHLEYVEAHNHPKDENFGSRQVAFTKEIYIEREDFILEKPNKKWKRWAKDIEVRLRHGYFVKCNEVEYDENGEIVCLYATYDKETKSGSGFNERKPNGTIHWVSASNNINAEFRIINSLLLEGGNKENFLENINPDCVVTHQGFVESYLKDTVEYDRYQFIRNGYFVTDKESNDEKIVFNEIVPLKSSFKK